MGASQLALLAYQRLMLRPNQMKVCTTSTGAEGKLKREGYEESTS